MLVNVGRNAPCPCKSGKKYKQCCLKKDEQSVRSGPIGFASELDADDIDELSNHALGLIRAGKLIDAEAACRALQETHPDQVDGLMRLAQLREAQGHREEAAKLYRGAAAFSERHEGYDAEGIAWFIGHAERLERAS